MAELFKYECPSCGGAIEFDSTLQEMKCPFCGTTYDAATLKSYDDVQKTKRGSDMNWKTEEKSWREDEKTGMRSYICQSCAGEILADATTGATFCPFCGNPVIMKDQFAGALRPDLVIPFKLDKKAAKEALRRHYKGKVLMPKAFLDENRIEKITGVYVPFWLYDADADADIRYRTTRVHTWSDPRFIYTETLHYLVIREGTLGFDNVPADGSSKMADDLMESIEPFDLSEAVDFRTAYLSGFLADKYDVSAEQCASHTNDRIRTSTEAAFNSTVNGYSSVRTVSCDIRLLNNKVKYALFPVWMLNTNWRGKDYLFAMNGQTGRLVGDLPVDWGSFWKWFGLLTTGIGVVLSLILLVAEGLL
jgi:DNA-directed RNA polymerase subunit RPC12/RpoP